MGRAFICLGALTAALLAAAPEARAKMVYYEINGQRYSYSTNNRAQVKEARQRIDAANAAEAAKAKAQAERSANPLVAVFGSKVQSDAKEAEARAQQALSGQARAEPAAGAAPEAAPTRRRGGTEAAQAKAHPAKTARARASTASGAGRQGREPRLAQAGPGGFRQARRRVGVLRRRIRHQDDADDGRDGPRGAVRPELHARRARRPGRHRHLAEAAREEPIAGKLKSGIGGSGGGTRTPDTRIMIPLL